MKINWLPLLVWMALAVAGTAVAFAVIWHRAAPVEVVATPPAQTMPVQPPVAAVPVPPKPSYRPVTKPKPVAKKPRKPVPPNYVVDCKMVPAMARTLPWAQVEAAARARGLTSSQIAQLRGCL